MKLSLSHRGRSFLLFLSAAAYVAWFSGLGERSDAQGVSNASSDATITLPTAPPNVAAAVVRDPFAGSPERPGPATGAGMDSSPVTGTGSSDVLVPNIATTSMVSQPPVPLVVRATIVGANPVAYVEQGTAMEIVRVGDVLGNERVETIDLRGLSFASGARLDLPQGYQAPPRPVRQGAPSFALPFDLLRRLVAPRSAHTAVTASPRVGTASPFPLIGTAPPSPSSSPGGASPSRLPTADTRGLTVGTNPTADPNAPTPFPYPYPYAPPR